MIVKLHCASTVVYKHKTSWELTIKYPCDVELGSEVFYEDVNVLKIIVKNLIYDKIKDDIINDMKIYEASEFSIPRMTITYEVDKEEFDTVRQKINEFLPIKMKENPAKNVNPTPLPVKDENSIFDFDGFANFKGQKCLKLIHRY